jgi:hypothetical protein
MHSARRPAGPARTPGAPRAPRTLILTLAAALVLSLGAILARIAFGPPSLPTAVADDLRARAAGRVPMTLETSDPARLESWLGSAPLALPTRVFDLRMMGYELRGGGADTLAGRASAVIVYREVATGRAVICRMLRGGLTDLPPPAEMREHDGISFDIYHVEGLTLVFWPEGDVWCVLVSVGEPDALIQLAFAKPMKARAHGV